VDGIAATQRIVAADAGKVVILTTFDRDDYLFESLGAGASGFLLKNTAAGGPGRGHPGRALGHALLAPEVTRRVIKRFTGGGERVYRPDLSRTSPSVSGSVSA
jgi:DNA-binding NarL/FixJ family response regulator